MSFFPGDYDPRDQIVGILDLCEIETTNGTYKFMLGTDGVFTDSNSDDWIGSTLVSVNNLQSSLSGTAPEGSVTLSFFQDPDAYDLITELKNTGISTIEGKEIAFYIQPLRSFAEFYAPTTAPLQWLSRTMRTINFSASGAQDRSITLTFETPSEARNYAKRLTYNTLGHEELLGEVNPSLKYMPTVDFDEEKLFG